MTSADLPPADPACRERSEAQMHNPPLLGLLGLPGLPGWDRGGFSDHKKVSPQVSVTHQWDF